jgi:RNase P subunit RPR2
VEDSLAHLAACFQRRSKLPEEDLVRVTSTARAAGSRWDDIAAACGVRTYEDLAGVVYRITGETGAELLFSATQYAVEQLTGSQRRYPPLTWTCPGCGRQVTDRAAEGRPVHVEHGHAPGCARLARDQAADDERRREQLPRLIVHSEDPAGRVRRHWLRERITGDCPRCGWHGYFHHYLATIDDDWAAAICDNCYADLRPDVTVTVKFYAARVPRFLSRGGEAVAVIRQRDRSDHDYPDVGHFPDIGQQMTWRLWWEHTTMLVEEARDGCDYDLAEISRGEAEQIAAGLAARYWPPGTGRLPWVACAYPQ